MEAAAEAGSEAGVALRVLGRHAGHMLLEDFKQEVRRPAVRPARDTELPELRPDVLMLSRRGAVQLGAALSGASSAKVLQVRASNQAAREGGGGGFHPRYRPSRPLPRTGITRQVLYALVASSLLQIDRSSSQSAVISLVHGREGGD